MIGLIVMSPHSVIGGSISPQTLAPHVRMRRLASLERPEKKRPASPSSVTCFSINRFSSVPPSVCRLTAQGVDGRPLRLAAAAARALFPQYASDNGQQPLNVQVQGLLMLLTSNCPDTVIQHKLHPALIHQNNHLICACLTMQSLA